MSSIDRWRDNILSKPEKVAFSFANSSETVSNFEVAQFAVALGLFADINGVSRSQIVGILHDQTPEAYLTQAALFLLGFPYVNIDPDSPSDRIHRITKKLGLSLIFCAKSTAARLSTSGAKPFLERGGEILERPHSLKPHPTRKSDLAYVVLTSGSTGEPKAVQITHANLDHFLEWAEETFALTANDVFATLNPAHFDNGVFDFFCSQTLGAQLHVIPSKIVQDPSAIATALLNSPCNIWFSVPSLVNYMLVTRALDGTALRKFTKFLLGGEGLPKKLLEALMNCVEMPDCRIWNVYGPSECACMCSAYELTRESLSTFDGLAPIGAISGKFRHYLKDSDVRGVGELVLQGPQVGPGYIGDEMATSKSFASHDTLSSKFSSRSYLTGDLMRVDDAGRLRFVGRTDSQVKIMGRRIELTEIELELLRIDGCNEAFVALVEGSSGISTLAAYIGGWGNPAEIRASLAEVLPKYMVPKVIHVMPLLPKNRNGKVDRKFLREGFGDE
ncbi:MAG: AMP-binding protein [Pontimonas sp.]